MNKYDAKDFEQNPGKYKLFCKAEVAAHIVTDNASNDLYEGEIVGIKYFATARNPLFRRNEPVYAVTRQDGSFYGHVYANSLHSFVL